MNKFLLVAIFCGLLILTAMSVFALEPQTVKQEIEKQQQIIQQRLAEKDAHLQAVERATVEIYQRQGIIAAYNDILEKLNAEKLPAAETNIGKDKKIAEPKKE